MCTIKILPCVDTSLTGDYKIRAEDGFEMFKNYTRNLVNTVPIMSSLVLRIAERCSCPFHGREPTGEMNFHVVNEAWPALFPDL